MENAMLFPGDTIGIIGDSQNGIMLAQAAKKMGFKVAAYCTGQSVPTLSEADVKIVGRMNDKEKLQDFAQRCNVVTYESENIASETVEFIERFTKVPQGHETLEITQDRLLERAFFEQLNVNIAPYATIVSLDDIYQEIGSIGYPCVLKPIQKGFGKRRQQMITKQTDIARCADIIDFGTYILESWVECAKELSVILTRDADGEVSFFPLVENVYRDRVLHETLAPAKVLEQIEQEAKRIAKEIVRGLSYVGVMQVAFFLTAEGTLYVKRLVPALSVPGYVLEQASSVSMFEQHLRALAKMPLGNAVPRTSGAMVIVSTADLEKVRLQWSLKSNWSYRFFRIPETLRPVEREGYILVSAETPEKAAAQIEATGIWDEAKTEEE